MLRKDDLLYKKKGLARHERSPERMNQRVHVALEEKEEGRDFLVRLDGGEKVSISKALSRKEKGEKNWLSILVWRQGKQKKQGKNRLRDPTRKRKKT